MSFFIITVDTEGDNLWNYREGGPVLTENTLFIPRFQELCEEYGFPPVYLTNYEMVCDNRFVQYIKPKADAELCEVGIHIHAWNNPPIYGLNGKYNGNPYLIEYPESIMRDKLLVTANLINDSFGKWPISHRAGRWAMNETYFRLLKEEGIKVDCSYTPHVNWETCEGRTVSRGPDYANVDEGVQIIEGVLEVPMSIRTTTCYRLAKQLGNFQIKTALRTLMQGDKLWVRPSICSTEEMTYLTNRIFREKRSSYIEMMIHSSELMPGGSPYFKDVQAVELLYKKLRCLFEHISSLGYQGITLANFANTAIK